MAVLQEALEEVVAAKAYGNDNEADKAKDLLYPNRYPEHQMLYQEHRKLRTSHL